MPEEPDEGERPPHHSDLGGDRLANLSHELRTPLNAILGFADMMHRGKIGPLSPSQHECVRDILTCSYQLLGIIERAFAPDAVAPGEDRFPGAEAGAAARERIKAGR